MADRVWLIACDDHEEVRTYVQSIDRGALTLTPFPAQAKMFRNEGDAGRAKGLLAAHLKDDPWIRFKVVSAGIKRKGAAAPRS